ncbi:MAG: archaetidylserine synthase [Methanosarcina sp.]|nr:archaetidylserine synthase [Methanosarcina sp.]
MNVFQMLRLPDLVSLLNLICGIGSIAAAAQSNSFGFALVLLLLAAIADGADGYIARRFKGGELGEQLDSLADAVSFGVAPALLIFLEFGVKEPVVGIFAGFYAICGVLRLARFNSTISVPKAGFEGLPITAGCIMLVTYFLLGESFVRVDALLALTLVLSILMVSTVSYPKIRNIRVLAFVAAVFGITMLLYFIDVQYMRIFSFLPFVLMLSYLFSPFLKVPLISIANSKDYGSKKGLKAEGRREKQ